MVDIGYTIISFYRFGSHVNRHHTHLKRFAFDIPKVSKLQPNPLLPPTTPSTGLNTRRYPRLARIL